MTVPNDYSRATEEFHAFLKDAADEAGLTTRHQSFTVVEGMLRTFRNRLSLSEAIDFAQVLPPLLRALFVADWDTSSQPKPFGSRAEMTAEVRALRHNHNLSPDNAIAAVAKATRRYVDGTEFEKVLARLPVAARDYWSVRS